MTRIMVSVVLLCGGIFVMTRCESLRTLFYIYEQRDWNRISLRRDNIEKLRELDVSKKYDLVIWCQDLSIEDIKHLKRLQGVRGLTLVSLSQLDGGFLRALASFESIQKLSLVDVQMDHQTMEAIRDMTDLRSLRLRANGEGRQLLNLEHLLPLAKVETLSLDGWRLTTDNARVVGSMASLRVLRLYADGVVVFLDEIPRESGIEVLDLQAAIVEPRAFCTLIEWEHLRVVIFPSADDVQYASKTAELRRRGVKVVTDT